MHRIHRPPLDQAPHPEPGAVGMGPFHYLRTTIDHEQVPRQDRDTLPPAEHIAKQNLAQQCSTKNDLTVGFPPVVTAEARLSSVMPKKV